MTGSPLVVNDAFFHWLGHGSLLGRIAIRGTTLPPKSFVHTCLCTWRATSCAQMHTWVTSPFHFCSEDVGWAEISVTHRSDRLLHAVAKDPMSFLEARLFT